MINLRNKTTVICTVAALGLIALAATPASAHGFYHGWGFHPGYGHFGWGFHRYVYRYVYGPYGWAF